MAPTPSKIYPRKKFDYDFTPPQPAGEPPLPSYEVAQNHVPNPYKNSQVCHERILAVRSKSTMDKDVSIDYDQPHGLYSREYPHFVRSRDSVREYITSLFTKEIAIYDGAMGTMIQNYSKKNRLEEEDFRGETFKDWKCNVKGNNDMLSITQPKIIRDIYLQYLEVGGSSLIGTNTFSSTRIAMADYEMEDYVYELNYRGARLAREACDEVTAKDPSRPRFVVGALGPTNRTASISPSVEDPSARNVTFDELVDTYFEQTVALVDGGADILMVETIFDTLNAKAALYAIGEFLECSGLDIPSKCVDGFNSFFLIFFFGCCCYNLFVFSCVSDGYISS
jgi:5-methyltetrahydrofolate--homocysteine methyltransferase